MTEKTEAQIEEIQTEEQTAARKHIADRRAVSNLP